MKPLLAIAAALVVGRVIFGIWAWAVGLDAHMGGPLGPERKALAWLSRCAAAGSRFSYRAMKGAVVFANRFFPVLIRAANALSARHARAAQSSRSVIGPGYNFLTGVPRCDLCGKEVRVRRGFCRSCGNRFAPDPGERLAYLFFVAVGATVVILIVMGWMMKRS